MPPPLACLRATVPRLYPSSPPIARCAEHKVTITEAMAEAMTPPRVDDEDAAARAARTELLMKLAKACKKQGSFHLATKKYTQVGGGVG